MTGTVIVEADGGSRGNPGVAGYGAVVWDADRTVVLAERREAIGIATNNVAEYRGLIAGLAAAAELGADTVRVRMDSKLVVEQMSGRWQVKHPDMIPLAARARQLAAGFDHVDYTWIPRAENSYADRLANQAMDGEPTLAEVRDAIALDAGAAQADSRTGGAPDSPAPGGATRPGEPRFGGSPAQQGVTGSRSGSVQPGQGTSDQAAHGQAANGPATSGQATDGPTATGRAATGPTGTGPTASGPAANGPAAVGQAAHGPGLTWAVGRPTRLLLLRHGQTELSIQRRYSGRGNPPLTALGREQAERAAKHLAAKGGIAAVVSSPLGRARETAAAVGAALGVPVRVMDRLTETDFGEWEGLTFTEAAQRDPELHSRWLTDPSLPAPGGESFDQVRERVEAARADLTALYPGENVVVVSHVTPIKTLLQLALGVGPSLLYRLHLDLASLSIAEFYPDGGASVRLVNETSYL
ncbi:bifunctional RNase H/acid phosphatase [Nocardia stercoris]|uniref:Bifunctional RNase H/acid phosphatase n=1 Tax=Nocardia stercoris TaxID=2483361 RepID=A0A3M2KUT2_9NOCA|nr:bifunctional RNase H/acid phosphatase [Nocardia stercoris]RMI29417.1 bifunctional RNase H/acid phosphatase [Nocardia stercoris]